MTTVYIIETLQTAGGVFMGPWQPKDTEQWFTLEWARAAAQAQSNQYGTITRVTPYPLPEGYSWLPSDYFYPIYSV